MKGVNNDFENILTFGEEIMANGKVKEIGQDDFVQLLDEHTDRPLVVDVFATWCAPCRMAAPAFEKFASKYGNATFVKVDADKEPGIAGALQVRGVPSFYVIQDRQVLACVVGADLNKLEETIKDAVEGKLTACAE